MNAIDGKDLALLVIVSYVAVMVLVRLMRNYRDLLIARFRADVEAEKRQQKRAALAAKKTAPPQRRAG